METEKMKVVVYNDTSNYHKGCVEVMNVLYRDIYELGLEVTENFADADIVVINGEGTMHDNQGKAKTMIEVLTRAVTHNKKTFLINTVFQNMHLDSVAIEAMKRATISCREVKSQTYLKETYDIDSIVNVDLSYWMKPDLAPKTYKYPVLVGQMWHRPLYRESENLPRVNIFKQSWTDIIKEIRQAEWFITGRHHDMYAALIAETPFVVARGNTWKNDGLLETAGVNIPTIASDATDTEISVCWAACREAERNGEYDRLWKFMRSQKQFSLRDFL